MRFWWKAVTSSHSLFNLSTWKPVIRVCTFPGRRPRCKLMAPVNCRPQLSLQYLWSDVDSSGWSYLDIHWQIRLASSTMSQRERIWRIKRLKHSTKLCVFTTFYITPVLLSGSETWTLLKKDGWKIQAFHHDVPMTHLGSEMAWFLNDSISNNTTLEDIHDIISHCRHALFGHFRRLPAYISATQRSRFACLGERSWDQAGCVSVVALAIAWYISWRRTSGYQPVNSWTSLLIVEVGWLDANTLDPEKDDDSDTKKSGWFGKPLGVAQR